MASFEARIVQVRDAKAGETVGYSATHTLTRDSRIAVAGAGYADGIKARRRPAARGRRRASGWLAGHRVPVLGRVSMDLTRIRRDGRAAHHLSTTADWIELFGQNMRARRIRPRRRNHQL